MEQDYTSGGMVAVSINQDRDETNLEQLIDQ